MAAIRKSWGGHGVTVVPWLQLMWKMRCLVLPAALMMAACGPPGEIPVGDAGDDTVDAIEEMAGLEFRWSASGLGENGDATLDEVQLFLRDIRAIGDATPGDDTYQAMDELVFRADGGGEAETIEFRRAPPGRYSAFEFELARPSDGGAAWSITGTCDVMGQGYDLEIEDDTSSSISLPLDLLLAAGETRVIEIEIAIDEVVAGVDWNDGTIEDDTLVVDEDSPLMPGMRSRLIAAFSIASIN